MILTEVWVPGHPRTKGSLAAKGGYATDTPESKRWRAFMAETVRQDMARRTLARHNEIIAPYPHTGPVAVWFAVWLPKRIVPMPFETPIWSGAGDIDKLARNLLDALGSPRREDRRDAPLCAGVYLDDNQVVKISGEKYTAHLANPGLTPGMVIQVTTYGMSDEAHWSGARRRLERR